MMEDSLATIIITTTITTTTITITNIIINTTTATATNIRSADTLQNIHHQHHHSGTINLRSTLAASNSSNSNIITWLSPFPPPPPLALPPPASLFPFLLFNLLAAAYLVAGFLTAQLVFSDPSLFDGLEIVDLPGGVVCEMGLVIVVWPVALPSWLVRLCMPDGWRETLGKAVVEFKEMMTMMMVKKNKETKDKRMGVQPGGNGSDERTGKEVNGVATVINHSRDVGVSKDAKDNAVPGLSASHSAKLARLRRRR
ncbi:uncharacterized protein B0I36DRAFT_348536 [Microdochium trichocladiopsis]|uniref:Uncharacterized protein n=1 Tax=Microdochium trichocladiopsis TaxID=1682393 RepID=A0A9P8YC57_9PEZI|nr:uncharacterized protein B0I36DRAFT_348536 [Microdochium trichocladiopsis]KAH7033487.1 hypothetical protein B0I36DRAFT_348536 [Microdochium trichocladiopsis]